MQPEDYQQRGFDALENIKFYELFFNEKQQTFHMELVIGGKPDEWRYAKKTKWQSVAKGPDFLLSVFCAYQEGNLNNGLTYDQCLKNYDFYLKEMEKAMAVRYWINQNNGFLKKLNESLRIRRNKDLDA